MLAPGHSHCMNDRIVVQITDRCGGVFNAAYSRQDQMATVMSDYTASELLYFFLWPAFKGIIN